MQINAVLFYIISNSESVITLPFDAVTYGTRKYSLNNVRIHKIISSFKLRSLVAVFGESSAPLRTDLFFTLFKRKLFPARIMQTM